MGLGFVAYTLTLNLTRKPESIHPKPCLKDQGMCLVAEWIHFSVLGIIVPTINLKV